LLYFDSEKSKENNLFSLLLWRFFNGENILFLRNKLYLDVSTLESNFKLNKLFCLDLKIFLFEKLL
jgi:hypothetical protein